MQKSSRSENQVLTSHGFSILGKWIKSSLETSVFEQFQSLVLTVWCEVSRRFFDLVDRGHTEKQLSASLEDFRGTAQFKYSAPWEEAFSHTGDPAEREDIT